MQAAARPRFGQLPLLYTFQDPARIALEVGPQLRIRDFRGQFIDLGACGCCGGLSRTAAVLLAVEPGQGSLDAPEDIPFARSLRVLPSRPLPSHP